MSYLYEALTGLKKFDVENAHKTLEAARVSADDFVNYLEQYFEDTGLSLADIDIVAMSYEFIADSANAPDLKEHIYHNYLDTRFDISKEEANQILLKVAKKQRNEAWQWIQGETTHFYN